MKEDLLRKMIRKEIKSSLTEAPMARGQVGSGLARVEKMASIKMLKKALGQGTPAQQAAGLLQVVQAISGNNPAVSKQLVRMLQQKGIAAPEAAPEAAPTDEAVSKQLQTRMGKLDKTQAFQMMVKTLKNKPASQQAEFVADFVKDLNLKGNITLLIKKIRAAN